MQPTFNEGTTKSFLPDCRGSQEETISPPSQSKNELWHLIGRLDFHGISRQTFRNREQDAAFLDGLQAFFSNFFQFFTEGIFGFPGWGKDWENSVFWLVSPRFFRTGEGRGLDDLLGGQLFWRFYRLRTFSPLLFRKESYKRVSLLLGNNSARLFLWFSANVSLCGGRCLPGSGRCNAKPCRVSNCYSSARS